MMEPHGQSVKVEVKEEPADMEVSASHLPSPTASDSEDPLSLCDMMGVKDHSEDASSLCDAAAIKEDVSVKDEPVEDGDLLNGTTTFVPNLKSGSGGNRTKKVYPNQKAERIKTGGGKPPTDVDSFSATVLPLLEEELNLLHNTWDSDCGHHQELAENGEDGSVIFPVSQVEDSIQEEVSPQPVPHASAAVAVEQPVARKQKGPLVKRKLVQDEKQEALKLAAERHQQNVKQDRELHRERQELIRCKKQMASELHQEWLELLQHEKQEISSYYARKKALVDFKMQLERDKMSFLPHH